MTCASVRARFAFSVSARLVKLVTTSPNVPPAYWFEAEPERTGKELFQRLQAQHPNVFPDCQLRTFQRRIKEWRRAAARQLVFLGDRHGQAAAPVGLSLHPPHRPPE